jgi:hypothetical protein
MSAGRQPAAGQRSLTETILESRAFRSIDPLSAVAAGVLGTLGALVLIIVPSQEVASIGAVTAWVVALSFIRVIPAESALITTTAVLLAVDTTSSTLERLTVPSAAILALALMYLSLRSDVASWRLGYLRATICFLLVLAGILLFVSNPSPGTAGAALFAVILAGCILTQLPAVWPLTAGLTCLGSCAIFLALGWIEIASRVGGAALFSLLAASVLLLSDGERE